MKHGNVFELLIGVCRNCFSGAWDDQLFSFKINKNPIGAIKCKKKTTSMEPSFRQTRYPYEWICCLSSKMWCSYAVANFFTVWFQAFGSDRRFNFKINTFFQLKTWTVPIGNVYNEVPTWSKKRGSTSMEIFIIVIYAIEKTRYNWFLGRLIPSLYFIDKLEDLLIALN